MMKLRYSTTSPFVRKVTVLCLETGLNSQIERVSTNPWSEEDDLPQDNPLGKVPALLRDDGETLFDSSLICDYLDSLHDGTPMIPRQGEARWRALRQQVLGNGICDCAVLLLVEGKRRPEEKRWDAWVARQRGKIDRALDTLEAEREGLAGAFTIGVMTVAITLDYLDFRFPDYGWRDGRPGLEAWHKTISERLSLQETKPYEA